MESKDSHFLVTVGKEFHISCFRRINVIPRPCLSQICVECALMNTQTLCVCSVCGHCLEITGLVHAGPGLIIKARQGSDKKPGCFICVLTCLSVGICDCIIFLLMGLGLGLGLI